MLKFNNTYQNHPYKTRLLDTEIYARRKSTKGMSQYALAEKMGVSRNCIYLLECHAHIPKIETIYDIMIALGFSAEERGAFLEKCMDACHKDKAFQQEHEKELAGAI